MIQDNRLKIGNYINSVTGSRSPRSPCSSASSMAHHYPDPILSVSLSSLVPSAHPQCALILF